MDPGLVNEGVRWYTTQAGVLAASLAVILAASWWGGWKIFLHLTKQNTLAWETASKFSDMRSADVNKWAEYQQTNTMVLSRLATLVDTQDRRDRNDDGSSDEEVNKSPRFSFGSRSEKSGGRG